MGPYVRRSVKINLHLAQVKKGWKIFGRKEGGKLRFSIVWLTSENRGKIVGGKCFPPGHTKLLYPQIGKKNLGEK